MGLKEKFKSALDSYNEERKIKKAAAQAADYQYRKNRKSQLYKKAFKERVEFNKEGGYEGKIKKAIKSYDFAEPERTIQVFPKGKFKGV